MSKLDQFIEKTKVYVVTDVEEKLFREKFRDEIIPCMEKIKEGLESVDGYDYSISIGHTNSNLTIHDKKFFIHINSIENCIIINATNNDNEYGEIERIILKDENLFSTRHEQIFTEDILVDYLNETFQGIIG